MILCQDPFTGFIGQDPETLGRMFHKLPSFIEELKDSHDHW
jgi:hypothetical protein